MICELRSRIVAQRAGYDDAYGREDDYAVLADRADKYLDRYDDLGAERAEAYLDRREQELNEWVKESVPTPTTDGLDTDPTPFTDQDDPSHPEQAGITLTTPETLPVDADARLLDPPIASTAVWKRLWQTGGMSDRLRDALDTLRGSSYREVWRHSPKPV